MRAALKAIALSLGLTFGATGAQAAPVTWTFTGTIDHVLFKAIGSTQSTMSVFEELADPGDTYVLKYTFDTATPPDPAFAPFHCITSQCYWPTGSTSTLMIGGHTFTVGGAPVLPSQLRRSIDSGAFERLSDHRTDYTVGNGGTATSTFAGVTQILIAFALESNGDNNLTSPSPWPTSVNLANWDIEQLSFQIMTGGPISTRHLFEINDPLTAFHTFHSTADDPVPAPGALALLGLGLIGLGATRRRPA